MQARYFWIKLPYFFLIAFQNYSAFFNYWRSNIAMLKYSKAAQLTVYFCFSCYELLRISLPVLRSLCVSFLYAHPFSHQKKKKALNWCWDHQGLPAEVMPVFQLWHLRHCRQIGLHPLPWSLRNSRISLQSCWMWKQMCCSDQQHAGYIQGPLFREVFSLLRQDLSPSAQHAAVNTTRLRAL